MNTNSLNFAKHEGSPAKHLRLQTEKSKQIKHADVAELVDARDLKSPAPIDRAQHSFKILEFGPGKITAVPSRLQNIPALPATAGRLA